METTKREMPRKPRKDFPLWPHSSGKWGKKVRGHYYYFGRWENPDAAEREYDRVKHLLREGRTLPVVDPDALEVRDLFNAFLANRLERVNASELTAVSYNDYRVSLAHFAKAVGPRRIVTDLRSDDFAAVRRSLNRKDGKPLSGHGINRYLQNIRAAFKFGLNNGLIRQLVPYGDGFAKVQASAHRRARREQSYKVGKKLFTPTECKAMIDKAELPLRAMILLGLNGGFLAKDCSDLPNAAVDLDEAWIEFPRVKTEVTRSLPLWPETVKSLRAARKLRPKAKTHAEAGCLFLTRYGNRWIHEKIHRGDAGITKVTRTDGINHKFVDLLKRTKIKGKSIRRKTIGFSALRSTFRTVADEVCDDTAINRIMGHADAGMKERYVRDAMRERLLAVTNHVRKRLLNAK